MPRSPKSPRTCTPNETKAQRKTNPKAMAKIRRARRNVPERGAESSDSKGRRGEFRLLRVSQPFARLGLRRRAQLVLVNIFLVVKHLARVSLIRCPLQGRASTLGMPLHRGRTRRWFRRRSSPCYSNLLFAHEAIAERFLPAQRDNRSGERQKNDSIDQKLLGFVFHVSVLADQGWSGSSAQPAEQVEPERRN